MARNLRYLFVLLLVTIAGKALAQSGEIVGRVVDEKNEPIINATVQVFSGGVLKGGNVTDYDGNYVIKPIAAGSGYEVRAMYTSYRTEAKNNVVVNDGVSAKINFRMERASKNLNEVHITAYKEDLIKIGKPSGVLGREDIKHIGALNPADLVSIASPGIVVTRPGADINAFGGRGNATQFILDGVVLNGASPNIPQGMLDQMDVMASGLSAKYGDATGAVINLVTRGPSKTFQGGFRAEHSVDGFNHNMASFNLSGPLISKKDSLGNKKPVLGFLLGLEAYYDKDRLPSYDKNWVVNDDVRDRIEATPLRRTLNSNGTVVYNYAGEYMTKSDMHQEKARPNSAIFEGRANAKLDFQVADNLNLTAGGNFTMIKGSANAEGNGYRAFMPLQADAIPQTTAYTGRGYLRFTQRFGKPGQSQGTIQNAYYTVQADYQKEYRETEDANLGRNIFKYAYVGKFDPQFSPGYTYTYDDSTAHYMYRMAGYRFPQSVGFQRSELNPLLANYTSEYYGLNGQDPTQFNDIRTNGGMLNGDRPNALYTKWTNTGRGLNGYSYSNNDQVAVKADASFDLVLKKMRHAIEFGLYYQQRTERSYNVSANPNGSGTNSLWQVMRQLQNNHFTELDLANPLYRVNGNVYTMSQVRAGVVTPGVYDTVFFNRTANLHTQSTFDRNLRKKLGLDPNGVDYLNVDGVDPNDLSLDMFSADELLNSGFPMVNYQGYDYTGKKLKGSVNFNDYFTQMNSDSDFVRNIGAFRPSYTAAYLLDHFRYKDIDFNIGVRVDRYDANTKVLADPYSLYAVNTVGDVNAGTTSGAGNTATGKVARGTIPSNMGANYVVYVDNNSSTSPNIIGYRNGDEWYDASGKVMQDPTALQAASGGFAPQPFLKNPYSKINDSAASSQGTSFDPSSSFVDYKPKVNVAPRISFSFPISTVANFYAHYDVMVQRPRGGVNYATPYDYYFLSQNTGSIINNPDLKPEKMFDYEVGFQQVLTPTSSLTISGFYKERKDMIQVRPYLFAYPTTYYTYGNRDFSTTKGLTLAYDLRRLGHIRMKLNYTMQFAEGTGSSASDGNGGNGNSVSSSGLTNNLIQAGVPNLRLSTALSYDSRHIISGNIDYRYNQGEGPVIGGLHILQNAGANFSLYARSGEPYTKRLDANPSNHAVEGAINGSRLPWHFGADLRLDKDFSMRSVKKQNALKDKGVKQKKDLYLNAFVYIQNVFNIRDIITVYGYTGRPDDDGFIASDQGQITAKTQTNEQSYKDIYMLNNIDPSFYNLPRRITLGMSLNF